MQVYKVQFPGCKVELRLLFEADEIDNVYARVYQELSDRGGIRGFRPGKAPTKIIRRNYDDEIIQQMTWMELIQQHCDNIIEEKGLEPVEDPVFPDLEQLRLAENKPLAFTISLIVRPIPEIRQYKGIRIFKPSTEVTEEDMDDELGELQRNAAEEVKPDRDEVIEGDMVTATVTLTPAGADEPLGEADEEFEVGSERYTPPIDTEMIGKKIGDAVAVEHTYPEDYKDPEFAGKNVVVSATIREIAELKLPEINDEFAADQGEFANLDELKATLREQVATGLRKRADAEAENYALAAIMAHTQIDLPESLVTRLAARSFEQFSADLEREKLSVETFADIAQTTEEDIRADQRARAAASLKLSLILEEIQRREEIEIDDEDFDAAVTGFAEQIGAAEDFIRRSMAVQEGLEEQLRDRALREKTIRFILDNCEVEEVPRGEYEEVKEREREKLLELVAADNKAGSVPDAAEAVPDAAEAVPDAAEAVPDETEAQPDEAGE